MIPPQVIKNFKKATEKFIQYDLNTVYNTMKEKIEHTLRSFGLKMEVAFEFEGYSSNTYLLEASAGVNLSSIFKHNLNIANTLNVSNVRILPNLKVYNDKSYIAIETSKKREKDLIWDEKELVDMKIPMGKDNFGENIYWNLDNESTPNKFTIGSVGSGKSVSILSDLEYVLLLDNVSKIEIFDPKNEFKKYIPNPKVKVYSKMEDIEAGMKNLVADMQSKIDTETKEFVFVIVDEYSKILGESKTGKELDIKEMVEDGFYAPKKMMGIPMPLEPKMKLKVVGREKSFEENFLLLSQTGRSAGFRISAATQISTADVLTTRIKVNYPVVVSFRVPKKSNSLVALDEPGAEELIGKGDGLIKSPDFPVVTRFQAFYKP